MSPAPRRTTLVLLLTVAAVVIPSTAWYLSGSEAAGAQAARLERSAVERATREAGRLAQQVALRLESLRASESRRPYTDYRAEDRKLPGCELPDGLIVSPLALGPTDPLIWAHFEKDEVGRFSLPIGGDDAEDARVIELAVLDELECGEPETLVADRRPGAVRQEQVVRVSEGVVTVGTFDWLTSSLKGQPALIALRRVNTPGAVLTQGFVILTGSLDALLESSLHPAHLRPGEPGTQGEARVPLSGATWSVVVDASEAIDAASIEAAGVVTRFRRNFLIGFLAALLAGGCVVLLVHRSDRLARQREGFAASAAHELRTPLAGMRLYGEMLAEGSGAPDGERRYARRIAEEADRLGRVVSNVLGYSQLERGTLCVRPEAGDLAEAARDSVERLRPVLESQGAQVEVEIGGAVTPARFDRDALHQILQNLLDNAEKYSRDADDRTIRVELARGAGGPVLSVRDSGGGVAPAVRRRLFRPFERHSDPNAPAGLGVGLALVHALAGAQGASVTHADAEGGGSIFSVHFPAAA